LKKIRCTARRGASEGIIEELVEPYNGFFYIKDAVDDIIEKVLENGGDIEFVDQDVLRDYGHIALIRYY